MILLNKQESTILHYRDRAQKALLPERAKISCAPAFTFAFWILRFAF
jgi:hypothetical protein